MTVISANSLLAVCMKPPVQSKCFRWNLWKSLLCPSRRWPLLCSCWSSSLAQVCAAGSIWLIAAAWQWAALINGHPELFSLLCVRPPLQNQRATTRGNSRDCDLSRHLHWLQKRCLHLRLLQMLKQFRPFASIMYSQTCRAAVIYSLLPNTIYP